LEIDRTTFIEVVKNALLVSIDFIICNPDNAVLLGLRTNQPAKNYWFVPGGRVRKNERIEQAFEWLSKEELGRKLSAHAAQFFGVFEHFYQENVYQESGFGTHYVVLAFSIKLLESLRLTPIRQHCKFRWWNPEELLAYHYVHPYTKAYLQPYI
jgi:colanic acid biosynthesis protein WcaH